MSQRALEQNTKETSISTIVRNPLLHFSHISGIFTEGLPSEELFKKKSDNYFNSSTE